MGKAMKDCKGNTSLSRVGWTLVKRNSFGGTIEMKTSPCPVLNIKLEFTKEQ